MYRFIIRKPAKKFIAGLPENERRRIVDAIELLPYAGDIRTCLKNRKRCLFAQCGRISVLEILDRR